MLHAGTARRGLRRKVKHLCLPFRHHRSVPMSDLKVLPVPPAPSCVWRWLPFAECACAEAKSDSLAIITHSTTCAWQGSRGSEFHTQVSNCFCRQLGAQWPCSNLPLPTLNPDAMPAAGGAGAAVRLVQAIRGRQCSGPAQGDYFMCQATLCACPALETHTRVSCARPCLKCSPDLVFSQPVAALCGGRPCELVLWPALLQPSRAVSNTGGRCLLSLARLLGMIYHSSFKLQLCEQLAPPGPDSASDRKPDAEPEADRRILSCHPSRGR